LPICLLAIFADFYGPDGSKVGGISIAASCLLLWLSLPLLYLDSALRTERKCISVFYPDPYCVRILTRHVVLKLYCNIAQRRGIWRGEWNFVWL